MSDQALIRALTAALQATNASMRDLASEAGDVAEWNRGGHAYEARRQADAALALAAKAEAGASIGATKILVTVSEGMVRTVLADGLVPVHVFDFDHLDADDHKRMTAALEKAQEGLVQLEVNIVETPDYNLDEPDDEPERMTP